MTKVFAKTVGHNVNRHPVHIATDDGFAACSVYIYEDWQEFDIDLEQYRVCVNCMIATSELYKHDYYKNRYRPYFVARPELKLTRKEKELAKLRAWNEAMGIKEAS
jgi:hypothetical protein